MKLLFLLQDWPYPPSNGYKQKIFNLLSYMGQRHHCDVLALGTPADLQRSCQWLRQIPRLRVLGIFPPNQIPLLRTKQYLKLLFTCTPPSGLRFRSHELEKAIDRALSEESYDVAHVELQGMAQYCSRLGQVKRVLSLNDSMSITLFGVARNRFAPFGMRLSAFLKAWPQMRIDKALFGLADAVHFVGAYDANWCRRRFGVANAVHLPLAVENVFIKTERNRDLWDKNQKLIIVDKLWASQHRNAVKEFLSKYWKMLRAKYPNVKLIVIGGKGMPSDFQHYVRNLPGVELHDWVDRLEDTLAETDIAVFPYSVQVGMKNRVIQCMAAMNAVVGTPNAFFGLSVNHRQHAFIAKDQHEIVMGIEELLASDDLREQMGRRAREFIQEHLTQDVSGRAWERLYEDVNKGKTLYESYA
jgi:glycosyltransferase involved in cell wall biosynthesis